jgi:hypothetical protein
VIDQLLVEEHLARADVAPRRERRTAVRVDPLALAVEPDRRADRLDHDLARRTLGEHVPDDESREVVLDHEQPAALGPDPKLGEVQLPDRVAMRRLEPAGPLLTDGAALAMHRREAGLTEHARDRLHRDPPPEESLELGADLRRPHRRVLVLVVEDRLGLVRAKPGAQIARRTRRWHARRRHTRRRRARRRDRLRRRRDDDQPLPLGLLVPATERLRRAPDRCRHLLALHARGDQREKPVPSTDPYRGIPTTDPRDEDVAAAKALLAVAQDHHFSRRFQEARAVYQQIVDSHGDTKQAATARQQLENLRRT